MICQGCVRSVTKAITAQLPNVQVEASVEKASVTVRGDHDAALVAQAVEEAGFTFGGGG